MHVYTIAAIAKRGDSVDEKLLQRMAEVGTGKYYRAEDANTLAGIYREIQSLERSRVGTRIVGGGVQDVQLPFLLGALGAVLLEVMLATTVLRRVP